MHRFARTLLFLVGAASGAGAALAQQQPMALPEVTVTAPRDPNEVRSTSQGAVGNPYFGNVRVEETKWPEVPCAYSRVGAATGTCRRGPPQMNFEHGDAQGSRPLSNCQIAHDLVVSAVGGLFFEADSLVFDPYYVSAIGHQRQDCYVEAVPNSLQSQFVDMNQVTRQGTGWRNFADNGDLASMEFIVGTDTCLAIEKRGPRWGGGYTWLIHASICRKDRQPVDVGNVATVLAAINIREHDPGGLGR
ncbi:MAG TPA: hypothetical protein VMB84_07200 [Stellaceae bacterium]|nr:hypothetical protein [Stellaceae bacterium]